MQLLNHFRISYLPPMMIYFTAGLTAFTAIIESFYIKDQLGLSASFLAGLAFWAGLPMTFKMPFGHLVDIFWQKKSWFVYLGALLMTIALLIMVGLTGAPAWMSTFLTLEQWYIFASLIGPLGIVLQDVVADAMTVEAVPAYNPDGSPLPAKDARRMHITMQTLGRVALLGGGALVAGSGGWLTTFLSYQTMYIIALILPLISVSGVLLHAWLKKRHQHVLSKKGYKKDTIETILLTKTGRTKPDWYLLGGSALLALIIILLGLSSTSLKEELVFLISLAVISLLMRQLIKDMDKNKQRQIISIAIIVFVFRATPGFGAGASWWQIDILGFDERFFGTLEQTAVLMAIAGMLVMKRWMARHSLRYLIIFLTLLGTLMSIPFIGIFYGWHEWTQQYLGFGARTIAFINTATVSPFTQVVMIPMLAWIAGKSPLQKKATYFAVFSAFTNLALTGSSLFTQYMNNLFVVERGQYANLGLLMISVVIINLVLPLAAVIILTTKKKSPPVLSPLLTSSLKK